MNNGCRHYSCMTTPLSNVQSTSLECHDHHSQRYQKVRCLRRCFCCCFSCFSCCFLRFLESTHSTPPSPMGHRRVVGLFDCYISIDFMFARNLQLSVSLSLSLSQHRCLYRCDTSVVIALRSICPSPTAPHTALLFHKPIGLEIKSWEIYDHCH